MCALRIATFALTLIAILTSTALSGFAPIGQKVVPSLHVVLVGAAAYDKLGRLEYPPKDIRMLEQTFRQLGGRFQLERLEVLIDQPKSRILRTIADVAGKAKETGATTLIYWSGHSYLDELSNTLALFPIDSDAEFESGSNHPKIINAIDFASDVLGLFHRQQRVIFVGDGCNIGEALVGKTTIDWPNLVVLSASKSDEVSIDGVAKLGHSLLAYFFAEALREPIEDHDGDGLISMDELFMHIYPQVLRAQRSNNVVQHPAMFGRFSHRTVLAVTRQDDRGKLALKLQEPLLASIAKGARITINGDPLTGPFDIHDDVLWIDPNQATKAREGLNVVEITPESSMTDVVKAYNLWREANTMQPFDLNYKRSHAIVIAIGDYERKKDSKKRGPTGLDEVNGMVEAAQDLANVLRGLGFEKVHELYDENATASNIDGLLKTYWKGEENGSVERLFIYFGAHGVPYNDAAGHRRVLLATYDYDKSKVLSTNYLASDLFERHADNIGAQHVMFAIDACSAGFARTGSLNVDDVLSENQVAKIKQLQTFRDEMEKKARNVLVAGKDDQLAVTEDGKSIFAIKLIDALKGKADPHNKGYWKFSDIQTYVKSQVSLAATALRRKQQPTSWNLSVFGDGEMLFYPDAQAVARATK